MYTIPVPFLGLAEVGRPVEEVTGEETASLGRLAAGEQIGLIVVNPLIMLHAFNHVLVCTTYQVCHLWRPVVLREKMENGLLPFLEHLQM